MIKTKLTKDSFNLFNFRADGHGFICVKLGSIKIVEGYDNLENDMVKAIFLGVLIGLL